MEMDAVTTLMTGVFTTVQAAGMKIMTAGVGLGIIFIGGKWLWGKTKQWLAKA
jgi:hypothetical protein